MSNRRGDFDDDEGFFESLMKRKDSVPMPDSMRKIFKLIAALVVLTVISLITWAVWPNGGHRAGDAVPIIRAESEDYKVEPEDRGGMIIPNKDSTIFETMDNKKPERKVENLLEDSEQPMKKEDMFADGVATADEAKQDGPIIIRADESHDEKPKEKIADVAKAEEKPVVKPVVKEVAPKKKVNIIDALKEEAGTATKTTVPKGNVYIQLAAVKSDVDAKTKWAKLKSTYSSLSSLSLKVQKADLGAKGVFYRVQAGPTSADNATAICAKIKAAGGDCLIAK